MTADTFEINASPDELATMTAQLDAAEAQMNKADPQVRPTSDASATDGDTRTADSMDEAAGVPEQDQNESDNTEVKPKDSSSTPDATEERESRPEGKAEQKTENDAKTDGNGSLNGKPKSAYSREMERRERSWKALNEEKQKFAAAQEQLARERQQWDEERAAALAGTPQYTPEQYEHAAKVFEAEGKRDLAGEARAEAAKLRANPPEARKLEALRQAQVSAGQAKSWEQVMAEYPNVRKVGSPENAEALRIVNEDPHLWNMHPNAPLLIARMATARLQATRVPELERGLAKAKARIEELEKLTSPAPGGGPTEPAKAKSFDDKSLPEQEAEIRRLLKGA